MSCDAIKLALEALEMSHELDDTGYADAKKYGLASDEDITAKLSTAITALREALAEQPEQQKPVAWLIEFENGEQELHFEEQSVGETHTPLCKCQPAQRKPLSEEWIRSRCGQTWVFEAAKQWVRLTEAAHNIKENT